MNTTNKPTTEEMLQALNVPQLLLVNIVVHALLAWEWIRKTARRVWMACHE